MIDKKLLLDIFRISSPSNKETEMQKFIKNFLTQHNIDFNSDDVGNIYYIRHVNKPLLSAHMDTVEDETDGFLMRYISIKNEKGKEYLKGLGVIGGDDKCGIYIILKLLEEGEKINFAFFVNEEKGMTGSRSFVKNANFDNVLFGLVLDRRGSKDIICYKNWYGTVTFDNKLSEIGLDLGFTSVIGGASDADQLREKISTANISVGYHRPHSKQEYVSLEDLDRSFTFAKNIVNTIAIRYPAETARVSTYKDKYPMTSTYKCSGCYTTVNVRYLFDLKIYACPVCVEKMLKTLNLPYQQEWLHPTVKKDTVI